MERIIWFLRHGNREDLANKQWKQICSYPDDPPLSREGIIQAEETALRLRHEIINHIFVSPFFRTLQTALPVANTLNLPVKVEYGFREAFAEFSCDPSLLPIKDKLKLFPQIDKEYKTALHPKYPETIPDMYHRVNETIDHLVTCYEGNFLIVGHAYTVIGGARRLIGETPSTMPLGAPPASLFKVVSNDGGTCWKMELIGDISHLSDQRNSLVFTDVEDMRCWLLYHPEYAHFSLKQCHNYYEHIDFA